MTRLFLIIIIAQCGACSATRDWQYLPQSGADQRSIYVVSHGWHTGLIIQANDLAQPLSFISAELGPANYYEFGWGDKGFYQAEEIDLGLILQATMWSSGSVLHVVSFNTKPATYFRSSKVLELQLSTEGLSRLSSFIAQTFELNASASPINIGPGIYGRSLFFASTQAYNLTHTCNTWVAEALAQAGVPMTPTLTVTASSVLSQVADAARSRPTLLGD